MRAVVPAGTERSAERFGFSAAAEAAGLVFVSGVLGTAPDGSLADDPAEQLEAAFRNVGATLTAAGTGLDRVVELTTFHVGLRAHLPAFVAEKARHVSAPYPAWTAIGVSELAVPGAIVEIRVVAEAAAT
jgi:enamine deaminase RidA (YjgF/YER057c/UK114 family)